MEPTATATEPRELTLREAQEKHIREVLARAGGNISEAARRLGIHRRSLQRMLDKI